MKTALVIRIRDNVATVLADIKVGEEVLVRAGPRTRKIKAKQSVPFGHKIALTRIEKGEDVIKYGEVIGRATMMIEEGEYVHVHNVESTRGKVDVIPIRGEEK